MTDVFGAWKTTLLIIKPETVIRWHQQGFTTTTLSGELCEFMASYCNSGLVFQKPLFGEDFIESVSALGLRPILAAYRSPWQKDIAKDSSGASGGNVLIT